MFALFSTETDNVKLLQAKFRGYTTPQALTTVFKLAGTTLPSRVPPENEKQQPDEGKYSFYLSHAGNLCVLALPHDSKSVLSFEIFGIDFDSEILYMDEALEIPISFQMVRSTLLRNTLFSAPSCPAATSTISNCT